MILNSRYSFMILGVRVDVKIIWAKAAYDIWALGYGSDMYLMYSALDINMLQLKWRIRRGRELEWLETSGHWTLETCQDTQCWHLNCAGSLLFRCHKWLLIGQPSHWTDSLLIGLQVSVLTSSSMLCIIKQALRRVLWAAQLKYDSDADKLLINC